MSKKESRLSETFTTVTPFSKILALILFIGLPILTFYLGIYYQQAAINAEPSNFQQSIIIMPVMHVENNHNITDSWQIYRNTTVGFEFKYPQSLTPLVKPTGILQPEVPLAATDTSGIALNQGFEINFAPFKGTIDDLINRREINTVTKKSLGASYPDDPIREIGDVNFNGISGKWYALGVGNYLHPDTEVYFLAKGYAFIFRFASNNPLPEQTLSNYDIEQLLSTFKLN